MGGQRLRDPDRDADVDAQVASGAGQVLHPTNEAGQRMRDPDDDFSPWGVSACATPTAMRTSTPEMRPVQDKSCTPRSHSGVPDAQPQARRPLLAVGGQRLRDPDRDADVDAQVASGAGQVQHPTNGRPETDMEALTRGAMRLVEGVSKQ